MVMETDPHGSLKAEAARRESFGSENSQTAKEFIDSQIRLEADAREVLPYSFDSCTYDLGPLRQNLFACLTCNPPPVNPEDDYTPAAVCYSCSIACHGEHTLVELFNKRNFVCDCGTTRMPSTSPCTLREDPKTGQKGVHSQKAAPGNKYNHNFRNQFCGCGEKYDPHQEKGTMFQCLGLGSVETGGCGEDWWHPECLIGLPRDWYKNAPKKQALMIGGGDGAADGVTGSVGENDVDAGDDEEAPLPPGFPDEDDFEQLICYKCIDSVPWLKKYAGTPGFLPPVYRNGGIEKPVRPVHDEADPTHTTKHEGNRKKRKADDDDESAETEPSTKRTKGDDDDTATKESVCEQSTLPTIKEETSSNPPTTAHPTTTITQTPTTECPKPKHATLPNNVPDASFSLFLLENFHDRLCRCAECFPKLAPYPQLREEEETYEPPLSDDGQGGNGAGSTGTGSLLERGEAALSNIDRVRAIEGAMIYNHLRDKVKDFLKPFAESGRAVSAEDIKAYFEKLRGDEQGIKDAAGRASARGKGADGDTEGDNRREQNGY